MNTFKLIALIVVIAVAGTVLQPARAEAIDPMTAITIAGAAVVVITVIVIVVIANMRDRQRGDAEGPIAVPVVVALDAGAVQGQ